MSFNIDPRIYNVAGGILPYCIGGLVLVFVVVVIIPLTLRFSLILEALSVLFAGLGSYFENRTLVLVGCLAIGSVTVGCCVLGFIALLLAVGQR